MDAKGCLRTPRHSPKNYSTSRKYFGPLSSSGGVLIFLSAYPQRSPHNYGIWFALLLPQGRGRPGYAENVANSNTDVARVGWLFGEGGCQRGAGKTTSSGIRGGEDIILRRLAPFGDCSLPLQPPCHVAILKKLQQNRWFVLLNCFEVST